MAVKETKLSRNCSSAGNTSSELVKFKTSFRNTIYDIMKSRGWKEAESDWDIYWADRDFVYELFDNMHLQNGQRVNHFRNGREVADWIPRFCLK